MADSEAYFTWADVAGVVKGEKRLRELLAPSQDTSADHPEFDRFYQIAVDVTEPELQNAGYDVPLPTPLVDAALRNAMIGIFLGSMTEGKGEVEPWIETLYGRGMKWVQRIGAGDVTVKGAAASPAGPVNDVSAASRISFNAPTVFRFDTDDDESVVNDLFGDFEAGRRRRRSGWGMGR